jgi:predicted DsbA family dithiol-disulfide isomerase
MSDTNAEPMPIAMVSDVVCPWCFIGKSRLDKAVALCPDIPLSVHYRPFFLNEWIPREGLDRADYLTKKFGSVEAYSGIAGRVAQAAADEGLVYNRDKLKRQPNTLDCHRLIRWADASGQAGAVKQRLMDLYFTQGADLTQSETLVAAAADCGLDANAIRARLASGDDVETVIWEADDAKSAGIQGVPHFLIGGVYALSGAQEVEVLVQAINQAIQKRALSAKIFSSL